MIRFRYVLTAAVIVLLVVGLHTRDTNDFACSLHKTAHCYISWPVCRIRTGENAFEAAKLLDRLFYTLYFLFKSLSS